MRITDADEMTTEMFKSDLIMSYDLNADEDHKRYINFLVNNKPICGTLQSGFNTYEDEIMWVLNDGCGLSSTPLNEEEEQEELRKEKAPFVKTGDVVAIEFGRVKNNCFETEYLRVFTVKVNGDFSDAVRFIEK